MTRRKSTAISPGAYPMPCTMRTIPVGAAVQLARPPMHAEGHDRASWYRRTGTISGAAMVRLVIGRPMPGAYREGGGLYMVDDDAIVTAACDPGLPA